MHAHSKTTRSLRASALLLLLTPLVPSGDVYAQGCVIARGAPMCTISHMHDMAMDDTKFTATVAHRWFKSDRHFRGSHEEAFRQEMGTEVINDSHFIDVIGGYNFTDQFSVNLVIPFVIHDRSSLYEHLGNASGQRFHTQASGLADIRAGALYWVFDSETYSKGNIAFGAGVKLPTGDYRARDTFQRPTGPELRYVDSSIQPGDGGWGFYLETQGFHQIVGGLSAYMQTSYLFNPEGRIAATGYSVPDSYLSRLGLAYALVPKWGIGLTLGARMEGVPPEDAIGNSRGRRRPGYSFGIEPGVSVDYKRVSLTVTAPVAIARNRQRTYGEINHGDAAFADYSINTSLTFRF